MITKFLSAIALILTVALTFSACTSLDTYKDNLDDNYDVDILSHDEIEALADSFELDFDDYGISNVMKARQKDAGYYAYIIECSSEEKAHEVKGELKDVLELYESIYPRVKHDAVVDGEYLLIGSKEVIEDAMN